jgi:Putative papain-like cysteine peptidase (DUF1796).
MKFSFLIAIVFLIVSTCTLHAEEELEDLCGKGPLFVSLGSHCEVAVKLRENKLRSTAFPFDWMHTFVHETFLTLLKDDFLYFSDPQALFQHPTHPHVLENAIYQIEFRHDWPFETLETNPFRYQEQLKRLQKKYERRISRFRKLAAYPGKVFFIRTAFERENDPHAYWLKEGVESISLIQAEEIKAALTHLFPHLNFTLVIVNYKEENVVPIPQKEGLMEFKVRRSHKPEDYGSLFNLLLSLHEMNQCMNQCFIP